ncbi:hypothetical protein Tco_0009988 [Tanacetum coccineum]
MLTMCARYQATPTKKYLEAIKRVFWYLRGTINMGLWYPKDTAMALTAYADVDHAVNRGLYVITPKLPDVKGKGKGIVTDEQAVQSLLDLQKPKKQSIKDLYIFRRQSQVTQDASIRPAQPQDDTSSNVVHDTSSLVDSTNDAKTVADME